MSESFVVMVGKDCLIFIEVNLMKIIHEIGLEEADKITWVRCEERSVFIGEKEFGVKVVGI
jgi:hypothetical protein